jgi:hypothetical protein
LVISAISEWSALDSDSSPTSSKPELRTAESTISPMPWRLRSRTGRVIMPAWQKRQPRVQPRKISTLARSWTVSASGTSGAFGYGHSSRSIVVRLVTVAGTRSSVGSTDAMAPSAP